MLRITVLDQTPAISFVVEGKLIRLWVKELERCWESALAADPSRPMPANLAGVTFIDSGGRALLARMRRQGANAEKIEQLVIRKVEEQAAANAMAKKIESASNTNVSVFCLEIEEDWEVGKRGKQLDDVAFPLDSIKGFARGRRSDHLHSRFRRRLRVDAHRCKPPTGEA